MATQSMMKYKAKYEKENIRQVMVKFNHKTEPELTQWIEEKDNMQGYIKSLILADMEAHKQNT